MAVCKSTLAGVISGKLGGSVAAPSRSGLVLRRFSVPTNPNTKRQNEQRAQLGNAAVAFRDQLTQAQRDAWSEYARSATQVGRLGEKIVMTGQQAFVQSFTFPTQIGQPPPPNAPPPLGKTSLGRVVITNFSTTQIGFAFSGNAEWRGDDLGALAVYYSPPVSCTRQRATGPWIYAGAIFGSTAAPITTGFVAVDFKVGECRFTRVAAYYQLRVSPIRNFPLSEVV